MYSDKIKVPVKNGTVALGGLCRVYLSKENGFSIDRLLDLEFRGRSIYARTSGSWAMIPIERIESLNKQNEKQCDECGRWTAFNDSEVTEYESLHDGEMRIFKSMKCECGFELL